GLGLLDRDLVALITVSGAALLGVYVWHALRVAAPIIDLRLLAIPTYRAGVAGGFLFRTGLGAGPFLLPLLFQTGFGMTAFQSGLMTFTTGIGAMFMKTQAAAIIRRFGFRRVLIANAVIASLFAALPSLFVSSTPAALIIGLFLVGGLSRSLQFTSVNTLAYADVPPERLSRATSFAAALQELSGSVGVTVAAMGLQAVQLAQGGSAIDAAHFPPVFILIGLVSASSIFFFSRLAPTAGASLLPTEAMKAAEPAKETARLREGHIG
ncbi:MAG TPA: MFS transporter, partial [Hyphomicrobium sp.]|nr:MFS transporter [Hyphomicrobium sp.]